MQFSSLQPRRAAASGRCRVHVAGSPRLRRNPNRNAGRLSALNSPWRCCKCTSACLYLPHVSAGQFFLLPTRHVTRRCVGGVPLSDDVFTTRTSPARAAPGRGRGNDVSMATRSFRRNASRKAEQRRARKHSEVDSESILYDSRNYAGYQMFQARDRRSQMENSRLFCQEISD